MLDGLKLFINNASQSEIQYLKSKLTKCKETIGDDSHLFNGQKDWFRIAIKSNRNIELNGSIHKYFNNGNNSTDFTFKELQLAIKMLCFDIGIEAERIEIQNIEIGVNVRGSPIQYFEIEQNLIHYKNKYFEPYKVKGKSFGYICKLQQFHLKIYDKGKQLGKSEEILRFELKVEKMEFQKSVGVVTLADLKDKNKVQELINLSIQRFSNIVFDDYKNIDIEIDKGIVPVKDAIFYLRARNTKYWISINKRLSKSTVTSHKRRFEEFINKYSKQNLSICITDILKQKFQQLMLQ